MCVCSFPPPGGSCSTLKRDPGIMGDAVLETTIMVDAKNSDSCCSARDLAEILAHQAFDGIVSALPLRCQERAEAVGYRPVLVQSSCS